MNTSEKYLSKCSELYKHINKTGLTANEQGGLNLPTNRFLALEGIRTWYDNAIFRPIADSTRPEAAIKYMVFSVINTLSGRVSENEYSHVDPYFAINLDSYGQICTEWVTQICITDGQLKLAVLLTEKFGELKNKLSGVGSGEARLDHIRRFICEEFFNYLTPYQLLFIQAVFGSMSLGGQSMWRIDSQTTGLFNTPNDQQYRSLYNLSQPEVGVNLSERQRLDPGIQSQGLRYQFITPYPESGNRTANCDDSQKAHYIPISICSLFRHIYVPIRITTAQLLDAINILDMPDNSARLDRYLWILTNDQAGTVYTEL